MKSNTKQSLVALLTATVMAIPLVFAAGEPEDVNNVSATPVDANTLQVTWDAALDADSNPVDHYRIYYGTESVQEGGASAYESEVDTPDNSTEYMLGELMADTTYYMSVTAIDSADTESAHYSIEASGTPGEMMMEEEGEAMPEEGMEEGDSTAPIVLNVVAPDKNHVLIGFSEAVMLPELLAEAAFTINEQINPANILEVTAAEIATEDSAGTTVKLTTADQTKNVNYIVTASVAITDLAGNPIESGNTDSGLFLGTDEEAVVEAVEETGLLEEEEEVADTENIIEEMMEEIMEEEEEEDITPPEDITNFMLNFKEELEKFIIMMNWTASINSAGDLIDQMLYTSMDKGEEYNTGVSLGAEATTHQIPDLEGGQEYTFKLTTKDETGNESVGVVKSIRLPQTGFGAGFLIFGSALAAGRLLRRKKNKDQF